MYWTKPKWMRWITFEKKRNKIIKLENKYWPMSVDYMEKLFSSHMIANTKYFNQLFNDKITGDKSSI